MEPMTGDAIFPRLERAHILACATSAWFPTFRKISPKTTIIKPLQEDFIAYLESDRVFLPTGSGPMGISELSDSDDDDASEDSDGEDYTTSFPHLDAEIRQVIAKYDGAVFPKLNWSSPQDAEWMVAGPPLKCQTPADVYLLLKSSDFIAHDLDHAFEGCCDDGLAESIGNFEIKEQDSSPLRRGFEFELVLKKWFDMPKSQEWRCFVRDDTLIGIAQRDSNYYEFLQPDEALLDVKEKIEDLFNDEISEKFPLSSYTFDVYINRENTKAFLLDFNPYAPQTDSLHFAWEELYALSIGPPESLPQIRVITSPSQASQCMPAFSHNRYPADVVNLSDGASIAEFAKEWQSVLEKGVKDTLAEVDEKP